MCDAEYGKIYAIYAFVLRPALLHAKPMRISANFQGILCPLVFVRLVLSAS
jgi:hypothetical protein